MNNFNRVLFVCPLCPPISHTLTLTPYPSHKPYLSLSLSQDPYLATGKIMMTCMEEITAPAALRKDKAAA